MLSRVKSLTGVTSLAGVSSLAGVPSLTGVIQFKLIVILTNMAICCGKNNLFYNIYKFFFEQCSEDSVHSIMLPELSS